MMCKIVLILLGQHYTVKSPMECCPRDFKQHFIKNNPVQLPLILLGQHCIDQKPMQRCLKDSRQYCIRKNPIQCFLNTLGTIALVKALCSVT